MTQVTKLENLAIFKMGTPENPINRLSRSIKKDNTTLYFENPIESDNAILGIRTGSYTELIYIPAGSLSEDKKTAQGVIRGLDPSMPDIKNGNTIHTQEHSQGAIISNVVSPQLIQMIIKAIKGEIATGSNKIIVGNEQNEHIYYSVKTDTGIKDIIRRNKNTGNIEWSDDGGASWQKLGHATNHGNDSNISAHAQIDPSMDTPSNQELIISENSKWVKKNYKQALPSTHAPEIYTPAYLESGANTVTDHTQWQSVTRGEMSIRIDGSLYEIRDVDFSTIQNMNDVALIIQSAIRTQTGQTETVQFLNNKFIISSSKKNSDSSIDKPKKITKESTFQQGETNLKYTATNSCFGKYCQGQSFIVTGFNHIKKVEFGIMRWETKSGINITVSLYETDANGLPTGSALASATKSFNEIQTNAFNEFVFNDAIKIQEGSRYAIVIKNDSPSNSYTIGLMMSNDSGLEGDRLYSSDNGASWKKEASLLNFCYKIHGYYRETGDDLTGLSTPNWTDLTNGIAQAKVLNQQADAHKVVLLNSEGKIDARFLP
ncbi:MAG: DUF3383 family protein [Candidatus Gracilibacteria bacterium]|nr:DUF3383 family protein [Candidatus Gracilibacteria bacterium]